MGENNKVEDAVWKRLRDFIYEVVKAKFSELDVSRKSYSATLRFEEFYMNGKGKRYNGNDAVDHALFREYVKWIGLMLPELIQGVLEDMGLPEKIKDLEDKIKMPAWIDFGDTKCENGKLKKELRDINPNSDTYNTTKWITTSKSCETMADYVFAVNKSSLQFDCAADSQTIEVKSLAGSKAQDYQVASKPDWLSVTKTASGIIVSTDYGENLDYVFTVNKSSLQFDCAADSQMVEVKSLAGSKAQDYQVASKPDWLSVTKTASGIIVSIDYGENL